MSERGEIRLDDGAVLCGAEIRDCDIVLVGNGIQIFDCSLHNCAWRDEGEDNMVLDVTED